MQIKKRVTKNMAQKRNNNINVQGLHRTKFSEILRERESALEIWNSNSIDHGKKDGGMYILL